MDRGIIGSIYLSHKGTSYELFEWKLENFSSLGETSDFYKSPQFSFSNNSWYIQFYKTRNNGRYCGLFLQSSDITSPVFIHFMFGVKKVDGYIEEWFSSNFLFKSKECWGTHGSIAQSEFLERKSELIPSDCLNIIILMSTNIPHVSKYVLDQIFQLKAENEEEASKMNDSGKVLSDIRKLFITGDKSDVVISVQGSEFKAHSQILAARIPVLSAMFQHDTLEKSSNRITITDCEPTIFKEFLHYIYSGTIQNSTADNIYGLYRIANKYLVDDLKLLCRKHIHDNLCVEAFCDTIQLAMKYEDEDLLQPAYDYFAMHFRHIIRNAEWLRYLKENPVEVNEIFMKSFGPPQSLTI